MEERLAEAGGCTWGSLRYSKPLCKRRCLCPKKHPRGSVCCYGRPPAASRISPAPSPLPGSHRQASAIPAFETELQERCLGKPRTRVPLGEDVCRCGRNRLAAATSLNGAEPHAPHSEEGFPLRATSTLYQHPLDTRTVSFRTSSPQCTSAPRLGTIDVT